MAGSDQQNAFHDDLGPEDDSTIISVRSSSAMRRPTRALSSLLTLGMDVDAEHRSIRPQGHDDGEPPHRHGGRPILAASLPERHDGGP